jgi:hypothetical protein
VHYNPDIANVVAGALCRKRIVIKTRKTTMAKAFCGEFKRLDLNVVTNATELDVMSTLERG